MDTKVMYLEVDPFNEPAVNERTSKVHCQPLPYTVLHWFGSIGPATETDRD